MHHQAPGHDMAPGARIGRYEIITPIASGGMACVYLARSIGAAGFSRLVAIKRPHPHILGDERIRAMFIDEAPLAARIRHPNVVSTLDLEFVGGDLFLVMDFDEGEGLDGLLEQDRAPLPVVLRVMIDVLQGLHAAHELHDERGEPLSLVHRDVSPHNILVGVDGLARISDFGVVHARVRAGTTRIGEVKGKFAYMAPEQLSGGGVDRRADIFGCGVILWECLAARRLHGDAESAAIVTKVLSEPMPELRPFRPDLPDELYHIIG